MVEQAVVGPSAGAHEDEVGRLGFVPSLEGLRALAVACVIGIHYTRPLTGGFIGVDLFFVLSGFLITTLLIEEHREHGRISLKRFYRRRVIRLGPALLLLVGVDLVVRTVVLGVGSLPASAAVVAKPLSFISNWLSMDGQPNNEFAPTWSLAVEEQFYVIWPAVLVLLLGRGWSPARIGRRAALIGFGIAAWCLTVYLISDDWVRAMFGSDTRSAGLLLGAALACSRRSGATARLSPALSRWSARAALVALLAFAFLGTVERFIQGWGIVMVVAAVILVHGAVSGHDPVLRWVLTRRPVLWMGGISYGLYLWNVMVQILLMNWWVHISDWHLALIGIPLTFACAQLSHTLVERPITRWTRARSARRTMVAVDPDEATASASAGPPTGPVALAAPSATPEVIDLRAPLAAAAERA